MAAFKIISEKIRNYFSKESFEIRRLLKIPRYSKCNTWLLGGIKIADSVSFVAGYQEIFKRENYKFSSDNSRPYIIDCGSNIGLSVIYFKKIYPDATVLCFEPDPDIFLTLKMNVEKQSFEQVILHNKALSNKQGVLNFASEGGFSGRIVDNKTRVKSILVQVDILSSYIDRKVDFLKIDIEGQELFVLEEIATKLHFVERMFIEYHSIIEEEQKLDNILILIKKAGYRFHIKEASSAKHPFIETPNISGMDNQLEIYAWR